MSRLSSNTFILIVIFLFNFSHSSDWLWVEDPQRPWIDGRGTIEGALISVHPQGIYTEIGLYLTFSARGLGFTNTDTLEVQFNFQLPEQIIIHDSWLWIGEEIIRAKIMDKWTAASIYEDIVNRRKDPSILFKRGQGRYELRIFPMAGNETRKVKISYLAPTQWNAKQTLTPLPTNLLRTSKYQVTKFHLLTWLDQEWQNPRLIEFPEIPFESLTDPKFGDYIRADITPDAVQSNLNFAIDSPLKDGIYLNKFDTDQGGIYQLAFLPSAALDLSSEFKVAILFDNDAANSDISEKEILNSVQSALFSHLSPSDSFNLIFSNLDITRASEHWVAADSITIVNTFQNLGEDPMADYSNLPSLLANGIDFIKTHGNDGSILLISSADQMGDYQVANQLIDDILALMDPILPIHVADFQNQNLSHHWIAGRTYYGNQYFYTNITRLTTSSYYHLFHTNFSFSEILASTFQSFSGFISSFDLHTKLQNGFCYGRFNMNASESSIYLNRPILQVGKYNGSFPFLIDASGVYKSEVFAQQINIQENEIAPADTLSEEIWVGNFIKALESETQTNDIVNEIIDFSINERVLSVYSAFICLEPERGGEVCYDCLDESQLVGIEELEENSEADSLLLQAYPNPFNAQTTIKFNLKESLAPQQLNFAIYNILGQQVRNLKPEAPSDGKSYRFSWDGINDNGKTVSSGNYFLVINTPRHRYSLKLLYLK